MKVREYERGRQMSKCENVRKTRRVSVNNRVVECSDDNYNNNNNNNNNNDECGFSFRLNCAQCTYITTRIERTSLEMWNPKIVETR